MKVVSIAVILSCSFSYAESISQEDLSRIGLKVWQNECHGTLDGLISWNRGEEFPSLGIGHFIWYPKGVEKKFEETFPSLIDFMAEELKGTEKEIPSWLKSKKGFPWKTKEEFNTHLRDKKVIQLRSFLSETIDLQTAFLLKRFEAAETQLLPELTDKQKSYLAKLKKAPGGPFALIDYVNFKGTGLSQKERYRGDGWGLLQVLQNIPEETFEKEPLSAFVISAKKVLVKRSQNAPPNRKEDQWLKGWCRRLDAYLTK
jgi:hypothetical protein